MAAAELTHSAQHHASKLSQRGRTIALIVVAMAFIMDLLDNTIVNIAIPSIQSNLGASYATIQWLVAGYSLTFAVMLITGGRMGDVFGYKKVFMWGIAGFTFASLLSGAAWNSEILIVARLVQGAMAALMVPQVMSLMQVMYKPSERGQVMGLFGAMAGIAASLGPVVGGVLIHFNIAGLDWRPIFLINIPVGLITLFLAQRYLPEGRSPHPLKLDIVGTLIVVVAMSLLIFPLIEGRDLSWPTWTFWMMSASLPVIALFVWWQGIKDEKDKSPLVVPALLKTRTFITGLIINITFEAAMLGFFLPFTLILQIGLGYEVIKAALTGIPIAIGISVTMAVFSQKLIPKLGRYALTLGTALMGAGLFVIYLVLNAGGIDTQPWAFIPGLLLTGSGMAMIMSPIFAVVLTDVDPKHAGSASGVLNAVQQLGGAIGVALIGLFFFGNLASHAPISFDGVAPQVRTQLADAGLPASQVDTIISNAKTCYIDRSKAKDSSETPESCKKLESPAAAPVGLEQLPAEQQQAIIAKQKAIGQKVGDVLTAEIKRANASNFIDSFRIAAIYEGVVLLVVFGLSFLLPRHIRPEAYQDSAH